MFKPTFMVLNLKMNIIIGQNTTFIISWKRNDQLSKYADHTELTPRNPTVTQHHQTTFMNSHKSNSPYTIHQGA